MSIPARKADERKAMGLARFNTGFPRPDLGGLACRPQVLVFGISCCAVAILIVLGVALMTMP
jgi:hypothetical protein